MVKLVPVEVYPLLAATGVVAGLGSMSLIRHITSNPEVRVNKEDRAAGVLENFKEGQDYAQHGLRSFLHSRRPEVMPNLNKYFNRSN